MGLAALTSTLVAPSIASAERSVVAFRLGLGAGSVVIRWGAHHIPDIRAQTIEGIGFGEGYAQAADNICTLADRFISDDAERSRFFGPDASYRDQPIGSNYRNLDSDFLYQWFKDQRTVETLLTRPFPWGPSAAARALARGYAEGYDRYLSRTDVARLPDPTCRGAAWVRPISELDVWRHIFATLLLASSRALLEQLIAAQPPLPGGASSALPNGAILPPSLRPAIGSNAVAIGAQGTRNHRGLLLANPHFPFHGSERFYQAHLEIPGRLDVAGVSLLGHPLIEIGHTAGMAWMHTVNFSFRFALYELNLVPGDPTSYIYNGQAEAMHPQTVSVTTRGSDGHLEQRTHVLWVTRYGPMVNVQAPALAWSPVKGYAMTDINATNLRLLDQFLAMDEAQSVTQLRRALVRWQAIPWVNTIAADSAGNAFYADISMTPHITDQQIHDCVTAPVGTLALQKARLPVLDGSNPACALGNDPDAVQPGILGPHNLPQLERRDYVRNSNDPPWLANPHHPLTGYPYVANDPDDDVGLRPRLAIKMIEARLHGTDGYGPPGSTVPLMERMTLNDRNLSAELARGPVVAMCQSNPMLLASDAKLIDVSHACNALERWDLHANLASRGEALWKEFWLRVVALQTPYWNKPFDPSDPVNTPNDFNAQSPDVERTFADAVEYLQQHNIAPNATVASTQVVNKRIGRIPIPGCTDAEGCFNVIELSNSPTVPVTYHIDDYAHPDFGSSSIQVTGWQTSISWRCRRGRGCRRRRVLRPHSETIMTYSQSANPASPFSFDQTLLFSRKRWITPAWGSRR